MYEIYISQSMSATNKRLIVLLPSSNFTVLPFSNNLFTREMPPVDLMVRSSGEQRISNFLLYQIAYAELYFTKVYWPDFDKDVVYDCLKEFESRQRRFGGA